MEHYKQQSSDSTATAQITEAAPKMKIAEEKPTYSEQVSDHPLFFIPSYSETDEQILRVEHPKVVLSESIGETYCNILIALNRQVLVEMQLEQLRRLEENEKSAAQFDEMIKNAAEVRNFIMSCIASIPVRMRPTGLAM